MQLDSTLEMSLEESTDTLPHTGLDQTADQSDLLDRNGFKIHWYHWTKTLSRTIFSLKSESTEDKSNTDGLESKSQDDMSIDSTEDDEV